MHVCGRGPGGGGEQGYGINTDVHDPGVPSNCDELQRPPSKMTEKGWGRKAWDVRRDWILPIEFLRLRLFPREENLAVVGHRCYPNPFSQHLTQQ